MKLIRDMLANDGVSQDRIASSMDDQSEENDRKSRNEAIMGHDGANQSGSAAATSTRSRRCRRPDPVAVIQNRVIQDINTAIRVKDQKEQVKAINEAASKSNVVEDTTNPLYCYMCTDVCEKDSDMKGYQCKERSHFVCRTCWHRVTTCPHCGQGCPRYWTF